MMERETLQALAEKISEIKELALDKNDLQLLELKLEGKADKQVAAVFEISAPVANQKKKKLYALIRALAWWIDHRVEVKQKIEGNSDLSSETSRIFDLVSLRLKKNEIAEKLELSAWKITDAIKGVLEMYSGDTDEDKEFQTFFENLRLGYKLPWVRADQEQAEPEPKPESDDQRNEPDDEPDNQEQTVDEQEPKHETEPETETEPEPDDQETEPNEPETEPEPETVTEPEPKHETEPETEIEPDDQEQTVDGADDQEQTEPDSTTEEGRFTGTDTEPDPKREREPEPDTEKEVTKEDSTEPAGEPKEDEDPSFF